jgi:hypothetical protein
MRNRTLAVALPFALFGVIIALALGPLGDDKAQKREDAKRLIVSAGGDKMGLQMWNQMMPSFKQAMPEVPAKMWDEFSAEIDMNELVDMCVPSYERHLSHAEIKELLAFYESPLGKKLVSVQPQIMQECMIAGEEWGRKIGERVIRKFRDRGNP